MKAINLNHRIRRGGLSLLELMLVMALLVAVAALAIPALQVSLKSQRIRSGGEQVRILMSKARVRAMKSGSVHALYVEPGGRLCQVEPWITADVEIEAAPAEAGAGDIYASSDLMNVQEQLPEDVIFYAAEAMADSRSLMTQQDASGGGTLGAVSPPILFYPDGTTSTAQVTITDGEGTFIVVSLRGLTGIARMTDLLGEQELALP